MIADLKEKNVALNMPLILNGYLDKVSWKSASGWAYNSHKNSVDVEILADGILIGRARASEYRADLEAAGFGHGKHAFYFEISKEHRLKKISARIFGDNFELSNSIPPSHMDAHAQWIIRRRNKLLSNIQLGVDKGIEFGPLCFPFIDPNIKNIRYVDHASTEDLRKKYDGDRNVNIRELVDIDYVWVGQPLKELIADFALIDYAVALHVLEHVPNPIGWLQDIHSVLKPGGILSLALPDKRYCFDYERQLTEPALLIEAYLQKYTRPSPRMIFDHMANVISWNGNISWYTWQDAPVVAEFVNSHSIQDAMEKAVAAATTNVYFDAHCWVFTPISFLYNIKALVELGLLPYKIKDFFNTDGNEFIVCFEAMSGSPSAQERQDQIDSVANAIYMTLQA